jgi:hypothetical protein
MSATDRQNRLLIAEDWKRIYQTFRNADFQSYDFENLRRVMISYIRENYPEDFNDYIESSEYLALIDLIAFLGQSISFRTDLNARDNFLELAERRESVLRLARLLSYNPKRNLAGNGLLKFSSVSTTQTVIDSNGRNLATQTVLWNDPANPNWYDQFIKVINAALPASRQFGSPDDKATIYGIPTEQYRFQSANTEAPVYAFSKAVDGRTMPFEIVSTTFKGTEDIYEEPPSLGNRLAFLYRNDGKGNSSSNTGFFLHFRQGILNQGTFDITQPSTSESIDIDAVNINNTDIWLYRLDANGLESEYWQKVPSLEGNNIIYNSLKKSIRNIYSVITRAGDRVSLLFSDGTFGNIPRGTFRVYYRTSNGINYTINPRDVRNVSIAFPYISNLGQIETLTITLSLQSSVDNSAETESSDSIKTRAPATYYTQNRMITAEDYNISPLSVNQQIIKIKAVNRSASGVSRYFDLVDPTGKFSKTNLFADDGILYKETYNESFKFSFQTRTDIEAVIYNQIIETLKAVPLRDFYYANFFKIATDSLNVSWYSKTVDTNQCTGFVGDTRTVGILYDTPPAPYKFGTYTSTGLRFVTSGALLQFVPPSGYYFDKNNNNKLVLGTSTVSGASQSIWCKVVTVSGDGTAGGDGEFADGSGPVILNDIVPEGAILSQIIPAWRSTLDTNTVSTMIDLIVANKPFGLRYDIETRNWKIVFEVNLDTVSNFSLGKTGDNSNEQLDASWLLLFTTDTEFYTVKSRLLRYIFESEKQIRFYFDASDKIYDTRNNTTVKDVIRILNINTQPDSTIPFTFDRDWEITEEFVGLDGYVDTKKIKVTFSDTDDDGVVDNPAIFEEVINTGYSPLTKYILLEKYEISAGQEDYRWVDNTSQIVLIYQTLDNITTITVFNDGQYFYSVEKDTVYKLNLKSGIFEPSLDYKVFFGRAGLKFQYVHNADYESRIDPGVTNIIDIYVLTKQYDQAFRQWLNGTISVEPLSPSQDTLFSLMSPELNKIKSISDEIIYNPVKYKVLFGEKATQDVQGTFKIVKNPDLVISDNDVKTNVLSAINEFFSLENWEFGESFYFTELSAYVMNRLSPYVVNFVLVPKQANLTFGALYEIKAEKDQIFVSGATVDDIEVITAITASKLKASGAIVAVRTATGQQIITSAGTE